MWEFLRISNNHISHKHSITQYLTLPSWVAPLTHFVTCEVLVCVFSCDCVCVCVHLPDGACVTSVEREQRVERFLSRLREIAVCCVNVTSFTSTETFKMPCKTACPTGSCTAHTGIVIMLTCMNTVVFTELLSHHVLKKSVKTVSFL